MLNTSGRDKISSMAQSTTSVNLEVTRLGAPDAELATEIARQFLGTTRATPERLSAMLTDHRNIVLAARRGSETIGFLVAYEFPALSGETMVYLYDIEVLQSARRRGVGRALVSVLKQICLRRGVDEIWVGSSLTNAPALALWEASGAERVSDQYVEFTFHLRND